jgi:outer membrane receptor protein involved in Fe transport
VDPTLGGTSHRASLSGHWLRESVESSARLDAYAILYDLDLFSNFTFELDDPASGDQFEQHDDGRRIVGASTSYARPVGRHVLRGGLQTRLDLFDVGLHRTNDRVRISTVRADVGHEWGTGAFLEAETRWSDRLRTVLGLRGDYYHYHVASDLPANSGEASDLLVSPKASVAATLGTGTEGYVSAGFGFHSNDARGTVQTIDPVSLDPVEPVDPLVRAFGAEAGVRSSPTAAWRMTAALWTVKLDSELLYVGDAGTTEPSDPSRRVGFTLTNYYQVSPELGADFDVSLARARTLDVPAGEDLIPGAIEHIVTAGVTWEPESDGPYAALRVRHLGGYPMIEDGTRKAPGATLVNLNVGWVLGPVRLGASVLNLLDSRDSDIQYFYASRLGGEPADGVEDVHFHPVEPRQVRLTASWGI